MLQTSWIAVALFSLAFALYRRSLRRACDRVTPSDDAELDAVIGAIEREP
jgi:DNA-binding GntR family transcriptional regulator